jgi:hypothetical protein
LQSTSYNVVVDLLQRCGRPPATFQSTSCNVPVESCSVAVDLLQRCSRPAATLRSTSCNVPVESCNVPVESCSVAVATYNVAVGHHSVAVATCNVPSMDDKRSISLRMSRTCAVTIRKLTSQEATGVAPSFFGRPGSLSRKLLRQNDLQPPTRFAVFSMWVSLGGRSDAFAIT